MAIVLVGGKAVHVRLTPGKKHGDPVQLSSNDEQAIRVFQDFLAHNRAMQRPDHEPGCRVPVGGSECSCDRR